MHNRHADKIHFWENTFWIKHTEVSRHADHNGTSFKAVQWSISEKTHFGIKHHFPSYLEGQTKCTLRFAMVQCWLHFWETHFGLKHHSPLYLEGQTKCILRFPGMLITWYKSQSYTMIHFWENTFWNKTSLSFVFRGPNSSVPWGFQACWSQWYWFQSCMMIHFWENTFWNKTSLSFVFRGPN